MLDLEQLGTYARVFGVTVSYLLGESGEGQATAPGRAS